MSWAKPKYSSSSYKKIVTLKEGEKLQIRILPPMFSLEDKGLFSFTHKQHFGYSVPHRTDPTKAMHKPFYCIERMDFRTRTITQRCPECDKIKAEKETLDSVKKKLKEEGKSDSYIADFTAPTTKWLSKHNLDNKQYYNCKFADGSFGTIKLPWTAKKLLDENILRLTNPEDKGVDTIDPIAADQGVWFEVSRTGKGFSTEYRVNVVMEALTVEVAGKTMQVKKEKLAPLTEEDYAAAKEACYDLRDVGIPALDQKRIQMLVECNGEPEAVEAVFGVAERAEASPEPVQAPRKAAASPALVQAAPRVAASVEESAPVAAIKAAPKSAPAPTRETSAPAGSGFVDPADMDEETFKRMFGDES